MADAKKRSVDVAAQQMIACACEAGVDISWDRLEAQEPQCGFGKLGICCRHCTMGPCRVDPFGEGAQKGVCGATADTIVARGLLRALLGGAAAHSDHGREIIHALALAAEGKSEAYRIKGPRKLRRLAEEYGVEHDGRTNEEVAKDLAALPTAAAVAAPLRNSLRPYGFPGRWSFSFCFGQFLLFRESMLFPICLWVESMSPATVFQNAERGDCGMKCNF